MLSRVNRQFFFFLCCIFHKPPHHIIILHPFTLDLTSWMQFFCCFFHFFHFFISYPHENDYREQNDDDVRCGKMESMWRCKGNKLKLPLGFILLFFFSSSENGIKRKFVCWMFLFFFVLWDSVMYCLWFEYMNRTF